MSRFIKLWLQCNLIIICKLLISGESIITENHPLQNSEKNSTNTEDSVCYVGDVIYEVNDFVPAEQPCLNCFCQPPNVICQTIKCAKTRPGCKAIHKPNQCCPEYQCECEHNGKMYANGERIETIHMNECKVCYCRSGEVQCTNVSCYLRTDCEPKIVPNQCCPKYDHCPPLFSLNRDNISTNILTQWPLGKNLINTTENPFKSQNDSKITIHEIIPDVKEIISNSAISVTPGTLLIEEHHPFEVLNDLNEAESSEISELFKNPLNETYDNATTNKIEDTTILSHLEKTSATSLKNSDSNHILSLVKKKKKKDIPTTEYQINDNVTETTSNPTTKLEIEENPAYPNIPDVMSREHLHEIETTTISNAQNTNNSSKILPEVLDTVYNNRTFIVNSTNTDWLKVNSEEKNFDSDNNSTNESTITINTTTELDRSIEEDSGEILIPKHYQSDFSASVESLSQTDSTEMADMLLPKIDSTEILNRNGPTTDNPLLKDVEFINVDDMEVPKKLVEKRESRKLVSFDPVFAELNYELLADSTDRVVSAKEDQEESRRIFDELLLETSSSSTKINERNESEEEKTLKRISDAVARIAFGRNDGKTDQNVFGSDFRFFKTI